MSGTGSPTGGGSAGGGRSSGAPFVIKAATPAAAAPAASSTPAAPAISQVPRTPAADPSASQPPQGGGEQRPPASGDRGDGRDAQGRWVGAGRDPEPAAPPTPEPPAPAPIPRLKVNGKEIEAPGYVSELLANPNLKPEVRNALLADLQRGMAADELFRGASERQQAIENLLKELKGPNKTEAFRKLLGHKEIGLNHVELAQQILAQEFAREQLSPEQRELEDLKAERDRLKAESEQRAQEAQQIRMEQHRQQVQQQVQREIIGALSDPKTNQGLPRTAEVVQRINKYMIWDAKHRATLDRNDPNRQVALTPADIIPIVKKDYQDDLQSFIAGMDVPAVLSMLGDDLAKKIREYDLAQLRNGGPRIEQPTRQLPPRPTQQQAPQAPARVPPGRETYEQARERILAKFK